MNKFQITPNGILEFRGRQHNHSPQSHIPMQIQKNSNIKKLKTIDLSIAWPLRLYWPGNKLNTRHDWHQPTTPWVPIVRNKTPPKAMVATTITTLTTVVGGSALQLLPSKVTEETWKIDRTTTRRKALVDITGNSKECCSCIFQKNDSSHYHGFFTRLVVGNCCILLSLTVNKHCDLKKFHQIMQFEPRIKGFWPLDRHCWIDLWQFTRLVTSLWMGRLSKRDS